MGKILVMDDDGSVRTALRAMLEQAGHTVAVAADGVEGARIYRQDVPDLIITDIIMPDRDGVEALLDLRRSHPDVRVIVISGNAQEFLPIARDLGADRSFAKPFNRREVLAAVTQLLQEGG